MNIHFSDLKKLLLLALFLLNFGLNQCHEKKLTIIIIENDNSFSRQTFLIAQWVKFQILNLQSKILNPECSVSSKISATILTRVISTKILPEM